MERLLLPLRIAHDRASGVVGEDGDAFFEIRELELPRGPVQSKFDRVADSIERGTIDGDALGSGRDGPGTRSC